MSHRIEDLERRLAAYAEAVGGPESSFTTEIVQLELSDVDDDPGYELDAASDSALLSLGSTGRCGPPLERPGSGGRISWRSFGPASCGALELLAVGARGVVDWRRKREAIEPAA